MVLLKTAELPLINLNWFFTLQKLAGWALHTSYMWRQPSHFLGFSPCKGKKKIQKRVHRTTLWECIQTGSSFSQASMHTTCGTPKQPWALQKLREKRKLWEAPRVGESSTGAPLFAPSAGKVKGIVPWSAVWTKKTTPHAWHHTGSLPCNRIFRIRSCNITGSLVTPASLMRKQKTQMEAPLVSQNMNSRKLEPWALRLKISSERWEKNKLYQQYGPLTVTMHRALNPCLLACKMEILVPSSYMSSLAQNLRIEKLFSKFSKSSYRCHCCYY